MPTLTDILADRANFPDTMTITLADGVETTLGELRGGWLRHQDYTRKTTDLKRERDEFAQERARFEQAKADAEQQLAALAAQALAAPQRGGETPTPDDVETVLRQDPVARRLMAQIEALTQKIDGLEGSTRQHREYLEQQQRAFLIEQHRRTLEQLKATDPELDEAALVRFAKERGMARLDDAYVVYTRDQQLERARKEAADAAAKEAYERAKRELSQPRIPSRRSAPTLPEDAPRTFDEAADRAKSDPEILATFEESRV